MSSPSPEEPCSRKRKMSTTSTNSDNEDHNNGEKKPRYKRRKIALLFAYCGVGYQGMQKNPGAKTIEGELEEALYLAGGVPEHDRNCPKRYDWARSARTDKGVSAVGQVVSGRFYVDPPGFVDRLNANLSHQIRIFGYKRVTPSFSAKKFCDRRRYVYLIPVFALDPCAHRDRESVLASLGSGKELVKCLECSERGRKVFGVMGKGGFESKNDLGVESIYSDISSKHGTAYWEAERKEEQPISLHNGNESSTCLRSVNEIANGACQLVDGDSHSILVNDVHVLSKDEFPIPKSEAGGGATHTSDGFIHSLNSESLLEEWKIEVETNGSFTGAFEPAKRSKFCYGDKEMERFNSILKLYKGTHNFHNFTTRTKAEDPSARRYIISFRADSTVTVEGIEFVKCEVVGQSFMLHQIRKMIGVAVAIMRNCAPDSLIETALKQDVCINVPTAPEVGLYLDECFFTSYNQKWKDSHEEVSMKAYEKEAEEFKMKHIYSHIASTEQREGVVALWLHSLNHRNYPDLQAVSNAASAEVEENEVREMAA